MASYIPPKKNTAFVMYTALTDMSDTTLLKANPTLAAGDAKVSIDGGAFANLATLPDVYPAGGYAVRIQLSAAENGGDNNLVYLHDAVGGEWCDQFINVQTAAQTLDTIDGNIDSILTDTGTDGVVVASGSKTGYKLASDGLDSVSITAPSGVASNFREMVVQLWRRFFKKATMTSASLVTYADDGTTTVTAQELSDDGTTQTQGESL